MNIEWYKDNEWFSQHQWQIKPHTNQICYLNYKNEWIDWIKCNRCGKKIKIGELAFRCLTNPIRLRPHGYAKVCLQCGYETMDIFNQKQEVKIYQAALAKAKGIEDEQSD